MTSPLCLPRRYYIHKQILPALERVLSLVGGDVRAWVAECLPVTRTLPHKRLAVHGAPDAGPPDLESLFQRRAGGPSVAARGMQGTIDAYYLSRHCAICDALTRAGAPVCRACAVDPQRAMATLVARVADLEERGARMRRVCLACGGGGGRAERGDRGVACESLDCSLYLDRVKTNQELAGGKAVLAGAAAQFQP